jgi:glycine/D-amino acid oxidase-like deaminating enzyme
MAVVRKVIVLGGGSAGFMAAGALKLHVADLDVLVIRSKDIGVIGVGEGSTVALSDFLYKFLHVGAAKFFEVARPTWKLGLKFLSWPQAQATKRSRSHFEAAKNSMIFLCSTAVSGQRTRMWCIATSHWRRV